MPVVSEDHRAAQRARVLAATLEVAGRKGLSRLAMSDIIATSGMSAGAIYAYFAGKDDVVYALAESLIGGRVDVLREAATERPVPPPEEAYRRLFVGLPEGFVSDGVVLQIWAEGTANPRIRALARRAIEDLHASAANYLQAWLTHERGHPPAAAAALAEATAPALVALAQGFMVQGGLIENVHVTRLLPSIRAIAEAVAASARA
ncbi:MAG: TetR/AcrR family transcriptional regulator [Actinobacteria bacterium]|nr:TetR/AcrR family transcriptional regulator [Actinomycetota bacterium]